MNTPRRILLIDPLGIDHADAAVPLAQALARAGAQVRRISLPGQAEAVLDAIEHGWVPVALKPTPAPARAMAQRATAASVPYELSAPAAEDSEVTRRPDAPPQ